ncbi:MAG: transglycosylase SLT domain-containing protein [Woeseiaceae bacterium]|nr:transglycosylase SLT domain-containing protein [Woeseiaceae bacterium]
MSNRAVSLALVSLVLSSSLALADDAIIDEQQLSGWRDTFRAVLPDVERGNWSPVEKHGALLENYVLWPDLRATWYKAKVSTASHADIEAYLDRYGILKPARELRYRYALHLAGENHLDDYLAIYQQFYQGLEIAQLDCLALQAELQAGRQDRVVSRARELWMVGQSQADECDPVFAHLRARQALTTEDYAARFQLAVDNRRFTLARYLSRPLDPTYREQANTWLAAQDNPRDFVSAADGGRDSARYRQQLAFAINRIAYTDPLAALHHWRQLRQVFAFSPEVDAGVSRHIALWSARLHQPEAPALLASLAADAANLETGRWLIRAVLLQHDWPEVVRSIDALPPGESRKSEWQYWKAVALEEMGASEEAAAIFESVSGDRGYHGFLAADALDKPYTMGTESVDDDPAIREQLQRNPELVRARELFFVGLEGRGRSEWDAVVSSLTQQEQLQAALLAHDWGWHSRAIATVAAAGEFDVLDIRYPLPWRQQFSEHSRTAGITDSWAYGVARSESLFMRDIRSSAGAIGIMQLMPATGRSAAREIKLPYAGLATLTDSTSNIRLGTYYLGKMYDRFDDNRVLATAAYNAGPHRVEGWLPESGALDARIWIENIPFNETRNYVRRVLTDEAIFYWRLTGRLRRISAELPQIVTGTSRVSSD